MTKITKDEITGVILAGGKARRMGGADKGLILLNGKPLIEHVIGAFKPQVSRLLINANRNHEKYDKYGLDIIKDEMGSYYGPLAGMASALHKTNTPYLITVPCDTPFISNNLALTLTTTILKEEAEISVAHNGERLQPVFCMMRKTMMPSINDYLQKGGRKIDEWFEQHSLAIADLSGNPECFENVNTKEDIAILEKNSG